MVASLHKNGTWREPRRMVHRGSFRTFSGVFKRSQRRRDEPEVYSLGNRTALSLPVSSSCSSSMEKDVSPLLKV